MSTSCIKIGFLLGEKWGISCSWVFLGFFFRNCLSSGNELRRKLGSHNGCNMTHGKELRTEILISSMEICGKTTPVSSAACTEMWTLQFLLSGSRCWLGKWPFSRLKATCGGDFIMGQKMGPQSKQGAELEGEPGVMASLPQRRRLLWAAEGDWCACCHLHTKMHQQLVHCI